MCGFHVICNGVERVEDCPEATPSLRIRNEGNKYQNVDSCPILLYSLSSGVCPFVMRIIFRLDAGAKRLLGASVLGARAPLN